MNTINKQEEAINENYKRKQDQLLDHANERDRIIYNQVHNKMISQTQENTKKLS